jgi:hypothetical protein
VSSARTSLELLLALARQLDAALQRLALRSRSAPLALDPVLEAPAVGLGSVERLLQQRDLVVELTGPGHEARSRAQHDRQSDPEIPVLEQTPEQHGLDAHHKRPGGVASHSLARASGRAL